MIDKIIEQYLKDQLIDFLDIHNIINEQHHGSRIDHSTLTALSCINHKLITNYHNVKISTLLQTDLSAAFDTVDHNILCGKLRQMGVGSIEWFESYLGSRKQLVNIDGTNSEPGTVSYGIH